MRIAALYDIHGNLPALEAVLAELDPERPDAVVVGGDLAPGPLVGECLELLRPLNARYVMGNGDREVVEGDQEHGAGWTAERLTPEQRDALAAFEPVVSLGGALFCHATPRSDTEIVTRVTPQERLGEILAGVDERVVVGGHTHQQFDRSIDRWRVINAGSVGIPYEGKPGAYWALLGPEVELRRTEYDIERAVEELRAGGFPDLHEMLGESLLDPIDPAELAELFERQATSDR
jgi:putative phosphoesterase